MTDQEISNKLASELENELRGNILPYWIEKMNDGNGGFIGRRDGFDRPDPCAQKGGILCARMLWTYSAAARMFGDRQYIECAEEIFRYLKEHFIDSEFGGTYWSLNADGTPLDTKKQFYAIAFTVYGLSEYVRATGCGEALQLALQLFDVIETHSRDRKLNGYIEATSRDWTPIADLRLSEKDDNAEKTMNTHLHIIEGYANLLRIAPEDRRNEVREAVINLIHIFLDRIVDNTTSHMGLFFDMEWNHGPHPVSYGHDIEASWLLLEAADVVGDPALTARVLAQTRILADSSLEGRSDEGWMAYELHADGRLDSERHWWVQAEMVVGLIYLYTRHNVPMSLKKGWDSWQWIKRHIVDNKEGEWHWSELPDGTINRNDDKAGFWKCPYHNSRMCLEVISRLREYIG